MKLPSFYPIMRRLQFISIFICGMIVGAAVFMVLYQHNMEEMFTINDSLKSELGELQALNDDLTKYKGKENIIRSIIVNVEDEDEEEALEEVIKNELKARVLKDLQFLKGLSISKIIPTTDNTPQTLKKLYNKLHTNIHENNYVVQIETIIAIHGELRIWIVAKEYTG
ncbi:hypothetical protein [Longirhabdus pacifica]|uniref:hypothetical protein n=1 Tax=Longirhabdus pacifica TaxID=2305227 RepID=UPI001008DE20|nr:hypothetical protein [Longirhabdus pacifica]